MCQSPQAPFGSPVHLPSSEGGAHSRGPSDEATSFSEDGPPTIDHVQDTLTMIPGRGSGSKPGLGPLPTWLGSRTTRSSEGRRSLGNPFYLHQAARPRRWCFGDARSPGTPPGRTSGLPVLLGSGGHETAPSPFGSRPLCEPYRRSRAGGPRGPHPPARASGLGLDAATASCLASGRSTHWASSSLLFGVRSVDNYEGPAQRGGDRTGNGTDSSGHKIGGAESTGHYAVFQDRPRGDIGRSQPCSSGRVFFEHRMLPSLDGPFTPRNAPSRLCCDVLTDQDLASNSEDGSPESQPRVFLGTSHSHRARRPVRL